MYFNLNEQNVGCALVCGHRSPLVDFYGITPTLGQRGSTVLVGGEFRLIKISSLGCMLKYERCLKYKDASKELPS